MLSHWPYLIILAVIALIIFGPKRLPELGEGLGKAIREFRKATTDIGDSIREETRRPDSASGTTYTPPAEPPQSPAAGGGPAASAGTGATPPEQAAPAPEPPKS